MRSIVALLLSWSPPALAGDDLSVTSLGATAVRETAIGAQAVDLLLAQRLRWAVATDTRALVDGRFEVDPAAAITFEESRVRELGVAYDGHRLTTLLGRHPLMFGGPRLVDGAQAVLHPDADGRASLGAWTGLVPDEFTTAPTLRYGLGPILAYTRSAWSASAVGDVILGGGGLDRAAALAQVRGELGRVFGASGRLDVVFTDGLGNSGLADGAVFLQARPTAGLRFDAVYDAYSSLLYQTRSSVDPSVQRFTSRIEILGLDEGFTEDLVDPSLHHVVGATVAAHGKGAVRPLASLTGRAQFHADPAERFARVGALVGIAGIADERLELDLDGNVASVEFGTFADLGLTAVIEPVPDAVVAIDTSFRALIDPVHFEGAPGWYTDLFVDVAAGSGTTVSAGGTWTNEPSDAVGSDVAIGGFLRLQQWVRPHRDATNPRNLPTPPVNALPAPADGEASSAEPSSDTDGSTTND